MPNSVTPSIPLNTAVPSDRRDLPRHRVSSASTSGTTPKMNANEVIRIGRSRSRQASRVALAGERPLLPFAWRTRRSESRFCSPGRRARRNPIWVKRLTSRARPLDRQGPSRSRHIGTTKITASGSFQLSYWAAKTKKTKTTVVPKDAQSRYAFRLALNEGKARSSVVDHSEPRQFPSRDLLHELDGLPRAGPRAQGCRGDRGGRIQRCNA